MGSDGLRRTRVYPMTVFMRLVCGVLLVWLATASYAQEFRALARLDAAASVVRDGRGGAVEVTLALTQAVPWRVLVRDDPARVILDFREVDWQGADAATLDTAKRVLAVRIGSFRPGWSRMVLELDGPYTVDQAGMATDPVEGTATITVSLMPADPEAFAAAVTAVSPETDRWALPMPDPSPPARPRQTGDRPLVVVLDPGHGGIDPGAERDDLREADIMLAFARELQEALVRRGGYEVHLTRTSDVFVPLSARVSFARAVRADLLMSLHADAIAEGSASGATIYTLSPEASDEASERLATRQSRDDLVLGADLTEADDEVAGILMDLARAEVSPRASALADALVQGIGQSVGRLHKRPRLEAGFAVLKAPDIPSVLLEVGFMSDPRDLMDLQRPEWRARVAAGVVAAIDAWAVADAADALRVRQ
jgi:N-acetylmuramoyl-L-alanine amidase